MSLSGPKSGQLAQLPLLLEDSKRKDEIFLFTQDWVLSLDINRPRMYGLPKTHKEDIPLRPILSMIGSSQHERAKWLAEILAPVLKLYSSHSVKDSFTFANFIQNCNLEPAKTFLCSFDISSLFTNVPLDETIEICADALY